MKIFWKLSLKRINLLFIFLIALSSSGCSKQKTYNGYVEGEFQYVSPTTSGILKILDVQRGQKIQAGQQLFEIDETELKTLIQNAKTEISKTKATLQEAERNFSRAKGLVKENIISKSEFDLRNSEIETATASFEEAKQNLISLQKKFEESRPKADSNCLVQETFFVEGEFIQAGKPVVSILSEKNIKIRFFIPQKEISKAKLGSETLISSDSCASKILGKISYVSNKAEFTPPVIFSKDAREKMVFMVEASPKNQWECLIPGLPVDIQLIGNDNDGKK